MTLIKITITDQIKILDKKIIQNEAQYDLDRKSAKLSAFSLTGKDLGLKPSTIKQIRCEYSPLGKIFNKGLDKMIKKKAFLKG